MAGVVGGITNNLLGLQQLAQGRQELEQRNKLVDDERQAADYLRKFQSSSQSGEPDYDSLNEAIIRSPQLSQNVLSGIGISDKRRGQDAASFISQAASVANDPNRFMQLAQARANYLQQNGRDPADTLQLIETYKTDPKKAMKDLQGVGAALANQGYLDKDIYGSLFGGVPAAITPYQQAQLDLDKERLGIQREGLNIDRMKLNTKEAPKPIDAKDIQGIQKDVSGLLSDTNGIYRAAKSLESLKGRNSPLSQTAAVFAFMKSLDPTSAVRETEQGQVYDAQGAASGLAAKLNKLIGEGGLTKEGFQDIVDTSKALADSAIDSSESQINGYLAPYEDTLPESFKKSIINRVPKRFGAGSMGGSGQGSSTPGINGATEPSLDDLLSKY